MSGETKGTREGAWWPVVLLLSIALGTTPAQAQPSGAPAETRAAALAREKSEKTKALRVYEPSKAEKWLDRAETMLLTGGLRWHPFFDSAYSGGGFTLGAGYRRFVSPYNTVDLRGSLTFSGYKRVEAEFLAPRLFNRRGVLSVIGGWREATQVGFYGIGTAQTSSGDRANYSFTQPYVAGQINVWPTRKSVRRRRRSRILDVGARAGKRDGSVGRGDLHAGNASWPWCQANLPARGRVGGARLADVARLLAPRRRLWGHGPRLRRPQRAHSASAGSTTTPFSTSRCCETPGCSRCTPAIETTYTGDDEQIPFFMLPALGGGSSLRGFASWRFRDNHSLLMQAEWRVLANRFLDMAVFYDAGKVVVAPGRDQFRRTQERLRSGLPAARTSRDTAPDRVREEQRGPRPGVLVEGCVLEGSESCAYFAPLGVRSS